MADVFDIMKFQKVSKRLGEMDDSNEHTLKGNGGGGTSGGMDDRIARLEKAVDGLQSHVTDLRIDVATLKENVRHLPTKPWLFTTLAGMLTVLAAIVGLIVRFIPPA